MYCTVKEIIREVLDTDVPDSECVFAVVLTRGDVRHIAQDWSLTDDELETVMQRLAKAKSNKLTVSVGEFCSKKVLGVCLEKKRSYCQFDSKLAQILPVPGTRSVSLVLTGGAVTLSPVVLTVR